MEHAQLFVQGKECPNGLGEVIGWNPIAVRYSFIRATPLLSTVFFLYGSSILLNHIHFVAKMYLYTSMINIDMCVAGKHNSSQTVEPSKETLQKKKIPGNEIAKSNTCFT